MPQTNPAAQLPKTIHRQLPAQLPVLPDLPTLAETAAIIRQWEVEDSQFCQALEAGHLPVMALGKLGVRLCLANRNIEAASVLLAAVATSPDDISLLNNLAVALDRTHAGARAIPFVERSLALSDQQADSWIFLGNLKRQSNDLNGAKTAYETALAIDPNSHLAWLQLGVVLKEQREYLPAIECLLTCVGLAQVTPEILSILGQLFYLTGQFQKSRDAYRLATEADESNPVYRKMFEEMRFVCIAIENGRVEESLPQDHADELLHKTFALLSSFGYTDAAKRIAKIRATLFPSPTSAYLLHAIHGDAEVSRSPNDFLVESFDSAAERFDVHLVDGLGYDIPQKLAAGLMSLIPSDLRLDMLDAGCGTGLCGPHVRGFSKSLIGVDLSPRMLDQAANRQIYDQLICAELTSFLLTSNQKFDAVIAADVVIYFGELTTLATALAASLHPGGLLAFSIERASSPGHHLLVSGRFAHHPDYIRSVFAGDFDEHLFKPTVVRHEANQPVAGNLFVFRRR